MNFFLMFVFGVIGFSIWEYRGGPRWRPALVILGCAVFAVGYTMERVVL